MGPMLPIHLSHYQAQIHFMNQVHALQRTAWALVLQEVRSHPAQFLIYARSQLFQGLGVTAGPVAQKPRGVGDGWISHFACCRKV